jgi:hypothetical protein
MAVRWRNTAYGGSLGRKLSYKGGEKTEDDEDSDSTGTLKHGLPPEPDEPIRMRSPAESPSNDASEMEGK